MTGSEIHLRKRAMLTTAPEHRQAAPAPRVPRAAFALALVAVALRLWRIDQGLPDFDEEAIPFREALEMWGWQTGRTDLDPGFFNYPTLTIYLHFFLQKVHYLWGVLRGVYATPADYWLALQIDPTPAVVLARLLGVVADGAAVIATWRVAERLRAGAGPVAGLVVALAATLIVTARAIFVDPILGALTIGTAERLLAYQDAGRRSQLLGAVLLAGLAAGAKYNGGMLVIALAWVLVARHGRRGWLLWCGAAAGVAAVFVATSPYVVLDLVAFWRDFSFERAHMSEGHLGMIGARGAGEAVRLAWRHLGAPFLLVLGAGLVTLPWRAGRRRELTVWLVLLPPVLAVGLVRMTAPRYLVPLIPPAAALVAVAIADLGARLAARRGWPAPRVRVVAACALLAPVGLAAARAVPAGADTTQACARRWCEENLRPDDVVLLELYGPRLRNVFDDHLVTRQPSFAAASPPLRARFAAIPRYRSVILPMMVSGGTHLVLSDAAGRSHRLRIFTHGSQFNRVFYELALLRGVDYFIKSEAVAGRYEADPQRYATQIRCYRWLAEFAEEAARCRTTTSRSGPEIVIYRLTDSTQAALRRQEAALDPIWWAAAIPPRYRDAIEALLPEAAPRSRGAPRLADGRPAPWVRALAPLFDRFVQPYLLRTAHHLLETGHVEPAAWAAGATLIMAPDLEPACLVFSRAQESLGRADLALAALSRAIARRDAKGQPAATLRLEAATLLAAAGRTDAALVTARRAAAEAPPGGEVARLASGLIERIAAGQPGPE